MSAYTDTQLQQLWIQNGGKPAAAPLAASIALAESTGRPDATNQNTNGSTDRGLWQINSVHGAQSTYDITGNVKAAIAISNNGTNWTPWSTFNSGAYKPFLAGNSTVPAVANSTDPTTQALLGSPSSTPGSGGSGLFGATQSSQLLYGTVWVGMVVMAAYLLYAGLDRSTHGSVSRTVGATATVARKVPVE